MSIVTEAGMRTNVTAALRNVGNVLGPWLEAEHMRSLDQLANATEETVMRQLQGRCRMLKDLISEIHASATR
jgi:hypothetical protein